MKARYVVGTIAIAVGVIWIMGVTRALITDVLPVSLKDPGSWADQVYFPSSAVSTLLYAGFLLAWLYYSYNKRCKSSEEAKHSIGLWLSLFAMAVLSNVISLVLFIQLTVVQAPAMPGTLAGGSFISAPPYEFLVPLTFINGLLMFWLPSCFLSQRTLRFIPPFSYEINSMTEKR